MLFLLNGALGAGKTIFTKGIAKSLGINDIIKSPTYGVISEYKYNKSGISGKLIHIDVWRIQSLKELKHLNIQNYLISGNVVVVEWAGKFEHFFHEIGKGSKIFWIDFIIKSKNKRKISIFS